MAGIRAALVAAALAGPVSAAPPDPFCSTGEWGQRQCLRQEHRVHDTCQLIETQAADHRLDPHFLARLLWQESRFKPRALSGAGAEGIAQFMPATAQLRGLSDTFDPAQSIEFSAQYLSELIGRFGNSGLAAVAYNGGEARAEAFVAKTGGLAEETQNYVAIITGLWPKDWRDAPPETRDYHLAPGQSFAAACHAMARSRVFRRFDPPPPRRKPWGVQIASGTSFAKARESFARRAAACPGIAPATEPDIIRKSLAAAGRRAYFAARIGFDSRQAAQHFCNRLRASDCPCAVYSNDS